MCARIATLCRLVRSKGYKHEARFPMLTSRRAFLRSTALFGGMALTAACAPAVLPQATAVPTVKPVAVKAAWVAKTANQMVWPLAKDAGYFDKYGLSFDLNYVNGSANGIAALGARDLDMASVAGSAIVGAQAAGPDINTGPGVLNPPVLHARSDHLE